ncbi:MAG: hypothetical protein ACRD9S_14145 [Pyrinomonadaceae bacterium]
MIDVFMLAREGILEHNESYGNLKEVVFCEYDQEHYPEIIEMIGVEGSGFPNKLEPLVLFEDTDYTSQFPSITSIQLELEDLDLAEGDREILMLKRQHLEFAQKFPFDFLNLDFCGYYYPTPPGILQINRTVDRMVGLQSRQNLDQDGKSISIDEFVLAVTCKFDANVPSEAFTRLERIVEENRDQYEAYSEALLATTGTLRPEEWHAEDDYDFFLGAWPKELLSVARARGWGLVFQDYLHYQRTSDEGEDYHIISLVCHFRRNESPDTYLAESIRVLNSDSRLFIDEVERNSVEGGIILGDLEEIVTLRNQRARFVGRLELDAP